MLIPCLGPHSESRAVISPQGCLILKPMLFSQSDEKKRGQDPQATRVSMRIPCVKWIQHFKVPLYSQGMISKIQTAEPMETMKTKGRVGPQITSKY